MDNMSYLETHRFALNDISSDKLNRFRWIIDRLKGDVPDIVGAVIFGSQIVGRSEKDSDIDSYVFVETDKVSDPNKIEKNRKLIQSRVSEHFGINEKESRQVRVREISESKIKDELEKIVNYKMNHKRNDGLVPPLVDFGLLFHLQIGNGLNRYRQIVLRELNNMDEGIANEIWKENVVFSIQFGENLGLKGISRAKNNLFPSTVKEAIKKFSTSDKETQYKK